MTIVFFGSESEPATNTCTDFLYIDQDTKMLTRFVGIVIKSKNEKSQPEMCWSDPILFTVTDSNLCSVTPDF